MIYSQSPLPNKRYRILGAAYVDVDSGASFSGLPAGYYSVSKPSVGESGELAMFLASHGFDGWCASGDLESDGLYPIGYSDLKRTVMTIPYVLATPSGVEVVKH